MGHLKVPTLAVTDDMTVVLKHAGAPESGTSGTGAGTVAAPGALLRDTTHDVLYLNEGTLASPYWTPVSYHQRGVLSFFTDWRDGVCLAVAGAEASATLAGSGIRIFGQGLAENDSGGVVSYAEGGALCSITTTDETAHLTALGIPSGTAWMQPDTYGPMVIDATVAMSAAITDRSLFIGFLGTVADALDPPVTSSVLTHTLVQDDLAGLVFDSALTDANGLFAVHNKSDEAATLLTTAAGCDTGVDFPVAGTYQRLRVEITALGKMLCFADKVQIASIAAALDVDEEVNPVLLVRATANAVKTMLVKHLAMWCQRA